MNNVGWNNILVVDDNVQNLKLLEQILTDAGYQVRLAGDGELALRSAMVQPPSLILLDIRMPGMDGFEVCRRLKADERTRDIPIIILSILEDERDKVEAFRQGAVDYITKPFQPEEVLARIATHLRLRELTEQLEHNVAERTEELTVANLRLEEEVVERQRAEDEVRLNLARQKALLELYQKMADTQVHEIIAFVADKCVTLTGSAIGFAGLVSDDDAYLEAHVWSEKASEDCPIEKPVRFALEEAGLWAEPIRQRRIIVVNDYQAPNPWKKGYPEGHFEINRFVGIPVVDRNRVVAVAGVANRREEYAEADLSHVLLFLQGMWDLIKRKQAENALTALNEELEKRVQERTAELESKNEELERVNQLFVGRELKMVKLKNRIRELEEKKQ